MEDKDFFREYFIEKINEIEKYENTIEETWKKYDENASSLYLNNLKIELCIESYKYLDFLESIVANNQKEIRLSNLRDYCTVASYILSTTSIFIAPQVALPSFLASIFLSLKKRYDALQSDDFLYSEEAEYINEKLDIFGNNLSEKINILDDKIDLLANEDLINKAEDSRKNKLIANKLLIDILDTALDSKQIKITAPNEIQEEVKIIINDYYKSDNNDIEQLIDKAINDYVSKADNLYEIQETTRKRLHKSKRNFYHY